MTDRKMRDLVKKGTIGDQYLLVGDEPLLFEHSIAAIRDALKVDQTFDLDAFFADDTEIEAIMERFCLFPFASARRLIIVKNIEKYERGDLKKFADAVNRVTGANCLVAVYLIDKAIAAKKPHVSPKEVPSFFKRAQVVTYEEEKEKIHDKIMATIRRDKLEISPAIIKYLESEFKNDITGLKNEFDKIKNYLYEAKKVGIDEIKDLAAGLCDNGKYNLVNAFLEGRPETLSMFEELKPYVKYYAGIVDALVRGTLHAYKDLKNAGPAALRTILGQIQGIDRKMKTNTYFEDLHMELFFVRNLTLTRKGGVYGR